VKLLDIRAGDASRQFAALPESVSWTALREHIAGLHGARETAYVTDEVTEAWLDFDYKGHAFSVNNQFGEFWFFVQDPTAPEALLREVAAHCARLLGIGE
jgi:hypothetical protein